MASEVAESASALLTQLVERPLSDIARELGTLREENAHLRRSVQDLEDQIHKRAQVELVTLRGAVKALMRDGASPIQSLEHRNALSEALVLVCTLWSGPATAALYEDIALVRMGQIAALARTLASENIARLVQRLTLDYCVVWPRCATVVRTDLVAILRRCFALRSLTFRPHPNFPIAVDASTGNLSWEGFNPTARLRLHPEPDQTLELHALLTAAYALRVLKLDQVQPAKDPDDLLALPPLTLAHLEDLTLPVDSPGFVAYVAARWALPRLTHLTTLHTATVPGALLAAHGARLRYLHLVPAKRVGQFDHSWTPTAAAGLETLAAHAPRLAHLVLAPARSPVPLLTDGAGVPTEALKCPATLRTLDVWCHGCACTEEDVRAQERLARVSCDAPAGARVRHLRRVLRADVPRVCAPEVLEELGAEARLVRFADAVFVQTERLVVPDSGRERGDMPWFVRGERETGSDEESEGFKAEPEEDEDKDKEEGEGEEDGGEDEEEEDESEFENYEPQEFEPESEPETDYGVSDEDPEGIIEDWERDVNAMREENLGEQLNRDMVLAMFEDRLVDDSDLEDSDLDDTGRIETPRT
ncbi:uncharacterized protein BXZ73DRAFT_73693 [Epithele typhae]|uniref:uncharacterized protein n=1 Tax=Epithele typhae TaxID=378194 RepID=UPI002007B65D|nr:uncharacterized protein BXZ73DRAFT_73693 [Epithele typhae]KAH9944070.1 hypothetical protein BXZ73DRAFT_73693 [Epithele typhae]